MHGKRELAKVKGIFSISPSKQQIYAIFCQDQWIPCDKIIARS